MTLSGSIGTTAQAAGLAALSNVIAQTSSNKGASFDFVALFQFILFAIISTPPNYEWQMWLERAFPGYHLSPKEEKEKPSPEVQHVKKRNVRNLAIKFGLDQIVGSTLNTYLFIAAFAAFRNQDVLQACKEQFWPMRIAALKVWPMVALLNFTVLPVHYRIPFANVVGVLWGIYLSLAVAR